MALMAHETFVGGSTPRLRVLGGLQKLQFAALARKASHTFFTIERSLASTVRLRAGGSASVVPIGANIPPRRLSADAAKLALGLEKHTPTVVVFGGLAIAHRNPDSLLAALEYLRGRGHTVIYAGPDANSMRLLADRVGIPVVIRESRPAQEVTDILSAGDIALAPFVDGVSPRRGSFLAFLQLGIPTVTTVGPLTGNRLIDAAKQGAFQTTQDSPTAFAQGVAALWSDPDRRRAMSMHAIRHYTSNHSWSIVSKHVIEVLSGRPAEMEMGSDECSST